MSDFKSHLHGFCFKGQVMGFRNIAALVAGLMIFVAADFAMAAGDAAKGQPIATQVCVACHATDGNSTISLNPKLAGQHPAYLAKQLDNFKTGERKNEVMKAIAATLTPDDMANLGAYFGAQTAKTAKAQSNGKGSLGEKIYRGGIPGTSVPACASCHGPAGAGIPVQFPRLAGQHADYTVTQLKNFRSGERANDAEKMMRMVASRMTEQDIAAVADYIQGLR
jgi:cytochrome c553